VRTGAGTQAAHVADVLRAAATRAQQRDMKNARATTRPWLKALQDRALGALVALIAKCERDEAELARSRSSRESGARWWSENAST